MKYTKLYFIDRQRIVLHPFASLFANHMDFTLFQPYW